MALVQRVVADDPVAVDLLDQALQRPSSIHAHNNVQGTEAPVGNSQAAALRRLRKDAPELHAEVLAGNLSAHAAMVKAGPGHDSGIRGSVWADGWEAAEHV